ncbi:MAG: M20/M25/M40 family metallo-hydrolase [bacterium]|nr:M20/M25/M40 family metallo-hydrolase [bacterium]
MSVTIIKDRLLTTFLELCRIDSISKDERAVADYVISKIGDKYDVNEDAAGSKIGGNAGNLYVYIPGIGEPVMFCAHLDTVGPVGAIEPVLGDDEIIRSAGDTVLGGDDKVALAALLELTEIIDDIPNHRPAEMVITVAEEIGLLGAYNFDVSLIKSKFGFVIDTSQPPGNAVNAAPGSEILKADFTGKAAHAGISPEKGISALRAAARAISEMKLGRIDNETTANIGIMESGSAINVIPEKAHLEGEIRSHNPDKLVSQKEHMNGCMREAANGIGADVETEWEHAYTAYIIPKDTPSITLLKEVDDKLGLPFELLPGGGGSDGNVFNEKGIECIVLGCGMNDVHSTDENVSVKDLNDITRLVVELVKP